MGEHLRRHLPLLRGQKQLVMLLYFLPLEFSTSPKCFFLFTQSPFAEAKRFIHQRNESFFMISRLEY